jgi:hypothetical protein
MLYQKFDHESCTQRLPVLRRPSQRKWASCTPDHSTAMQPSKKGEPAYSILSSNCLRQSGQIGDYRENGIQATPFGETLDNPVRDIGRSIR